MAMMLSKSSSRSYKRRRASASGFTEINVTPLVDVMLVLLIIFMVAAPMLTVGVPVDLPKTQAAKLNDQVEPIVVSVDASGKSFLQETELEGEALIGRLMAITGSNPDARIFVRGDKSINYGRVMEIMGQIAAAGFNKVSLIAEMPMNAQAPKTLAPVTQPGSTPKTAVSIPKAAAPQGMQPKHSVGGTKPTQQARSPQALPIPKGQPLKAPTAKPSLPPQPVVKRGQ
jgi:biopolymer transport protein TolR